MVDIHIELEYQPLSNNRMWRGQRYKTKEYIQYERDLALLLPRTGQITGFVEIKYRFYVPGNHRRDISNFIKPLEDILVKKGYIQDDSKVMKFTAERVPSEVWKIEVIIESYSCV